MLYRSKDNKYLFGICGGLGEYFNTDPNIMRLLVVLLALVNLFSSLFAIIIFYMVAYFIIPEHPEERGRGKEEQKYESEKEEEEPEKKNPTARPRKK